jgi:spore germination protein KC
VILKVPTIKTILSYFSVVLPLFLLGGCWDKSEVEEKAYVIGLGLDKDGQTDALKITFLVANAEVGSQQSASNTKEPAQEILTINANDFISARNTANAIIAREVTYELLKVFVISEEMAQDKNFVRYMYDATRDREIRRDSYLIVSREPASEFFLKNKPKLETRPHKYFQFMIARGIEIGLIPDSDLHRFFKVTEQRGDLFLAMYATTKGNYPKKGRNEDQYLAGEIDAKGKANPTQFIGSAVFKDGRMIGKITGEETRISLLLDPASELVDVFSTYPDPFHDGFRVGVRVYQDKKNKINVQLKSGTPTISAYIPVMVEVLSDPGMTNYGTSEANKATLKKSIEKALEKKVQKFVAKTQKEFKGNPFNWSPYVRRKFGTISAYEKYNWLDKYSNASISIDVDLKFSDFGKQEKIPNLDKLRD